MSLHWGSGLTQIWETVVQTLGVVVQTFAIILALIVAITGWLYDAYQRRKATEDARQAAAQAQAWRISWSLTPEEPIPEPNPSMTHLYSQRSVLSVHNGSDRPIHDLHVEKVSWTAYTGIVLTWFTEDWHVPTLPPGRTTSRTGGWRSEHGGQPPDYRFDEVDVHMTWTDSDGNRFSSIGNRRPLGRNTPEGA